MKLPVQDERTRGKLAELIVQLVMFAGSATNATLNFKESFLVGAHKYITAHQNTVKHQLNTAGNQHQAPNTTMCIL